MTHKLRQKPESRVSILVYQGGRAGEFLNSLLGHHNNVDNIVTKVNSYDRDPVLNRFKEHESNSTKLFNLWAFEKKKPTVSEFNLDPHKNHLLRSHCAAPFHEIFGPNCKVIMVYSEKYNNFFSSLYWVKHLLQPQASRGNLTAWQNIVTTGRGPIKNKDIKIVIDFLRYTIELNRKDVSKNNWYDCVC